MHFNLSLRKDKYTIHIRNVYLLTYFSSSNWSKKIGLKWDLYWNDYYYYYKIFIPYFRINSSRHFFLHIPHIKANFVRFCHYLTWHACSSIKIYFISMVMSFGIQFWKFHVKWNEFTSQYKWNWRVA